MPPISQVQLDVGRRADGNEFARVTFDVTFTTCENSVGVPYHCDVALLEIDAGKDRYYRDLASPRSLGWSGGNLDDWTGWVRNFTIYPSTTSRSFSLERAWHFRSNESGDEEYKALISLVPYSGYAATRSNTLAIDVA